MGRLFFLTYFALRKHMRHCVLRSVGKAPGVLAFPQREHVRLPWTRGVMALCVLAARPSFLA